jgi:hypothetical protein
VCDSAGERSSCALYGSKRLFSNAFCGGKKTGCSKATGCIRVWAPELNEGPLQEYASRLRSSSNSGAASGCGSTPVRFAWRQWARTRSGPRTSRASSKLKSIRWVGRSDIGHTARSSTTGRLRNRDRTADAVLRGSYSSRASSSCKGCARTSVNYVPDRSAYFKLTWRREATFTKILTGGASVRVFGERNHCAAISAQSGFKFWWIRE